MNFAPSGKSLSFEVTLDAPSLPVAMSVYDDSGPTPVLVQGPTAMTNVFSNTYRGKFTGQNGKQYLILKAVYTDGTFATLDVNYMQGSESLRTDDFSVLFGTIVDDLEAVVAQLLGVTTPTTVLGVVRAGDVEGSLFEDDAIVGEIDSDEVEGG